MPNAYCFLSHDVDWRFEGPPKQHVIERRERFDQTVLDNLDSVNPYNNFEEIMEIEERYGCRSTFFFRTRYENGDFRKYADQIRVLEDGGWEIGLHLDPGSVGDASKIRQEYDDLSTITRNRIIGNRVHYLGYDDKLPSMLNEVGILYDSTKKRSNTRLASEDFGVEKMGGIVEFPLTAGDVYLFGYMKYGEEDVIPFFDRLVKRCRERAGQRIFSVVWHDNTLKMRGGRMYSKVIDFLHSREVVLCTGKKMYEMINRGEPDLM